jgi:uncharacterized Ntn-hydrolase superfamily protein
VTYSIVARDPDTGELGVAVQSHWFSVGSIVTWAQPGVGAVATQANAEAAYGPGALALLADGVPAPEALERLVAADPGGPSRQVAVVDTAGRVGVHTGPNCIAYAGHITGDGVSCQANIMASERVWPAMLDAFEAGAGSASLTVRLLDALDAAEREGGDLRGRQSAAILVVPAEGEPWRTIVSLRVEDHPEPLSELRRLVTLRDAYRLAGQADELLNAGLGEEAGRLYVQASERAPGNHELLFWAGLGTAATGEVERGLAMVRSAIELQPAWRELLTRLPHELAPAAPAILARLDAAVSGLPPAPAATRLGPAGAP